MKIIRVILSAFDQEKRSMTRKRMLKTRILAFGAVIIILVIGLGKTGVIHWKKSLPHAPRFAGMPVPVVPVVRRTIPIYKEYIGTTEALRNVALQAMVSGYLERQIVPDGSDVRKGELLYQIDPRNFQASYDEAKAQVDRDNASFEYARANQIRNSLMVVHGDVSRDAFQQSTSVMHQAGATILADKAALELARINLGYTKIRAPFSGRLSRSLVYTGNLIGTGTQINTLVQLDPIYATFNPPESDLLAILAHQQKGGMSAKIFLSQQPGRPYHGRLTFLDNVIDRQTGTITARVTIRNHNKSLIPGEFVHVRLHVSDHPNALLVPQVAVGMNQTGKFVFVVEKGNHVGIHFVKTGVLQGDLIEILSGIADGDQVVVGNQQKIGPGMPVVPLYPKHKGGTS